MSTARRLGIMLCALGLLTACATTTPPQHQQAEAAEPVRTQPAPVELATLPEVVLTSELLYQLLVAEFAAQQGTLHLSAQAYLQTAQTTHDPRLAQLATRMAIYSRDMELALHAAQLWAELEPRRIDAQQSLAALLLRQGHTEQATQHMRQVIELAPQGTGQGFMIVSNLLSQESNQPLALQIMQSLVEQYPDEPLAHYAHASLANQFGEHAQALAILEELLQQQPKLLDALILQARVHHATGNPSAALQSMHNAVTQHPDNHQIRLLYARMLVDANRLGEAQAQFRLLQQSQPEDGDIIYALALLATEAGELDDAEQLFMQLLQTGEREEEARLSLGQIAQQRKQYSEAIEWYQSLGPESDRYMEAQIQAARLILQQENLDKALDYLRGLSLHNQDDITRRYLGEAELLTNAGEYEQAMEVYDEGIALFMDHPDLLYGRALLAERMDRLEQVEQDLLQILANDPEHVHALNALGYTLVDRTERFTEGFDYIQRAYRMRPNDPAILDSMGWAHYRLGRLPEAEDYLRRAYAHMPDAEIGAHLGEVLWVMGRQDEARQIWREVQQLNPDHPVLLETLERFNP